MSTIKIGPYQVYDSTSSTVSSSCSSLEATASYLRSFGSMELLTAAAIDEIAEYSLYSNKSPDPQSHTTPPTSPDHSSVNSECTRLISKESVDCDDGSFIASRPMTKVRPVSALLGSALECPPQLPCSNPIDVPKRGDSLTPPTEVPPIVPKRTSSLFPSTSRLPDRELIQQAKRLSVMLNITHEPNPSKRSLKSTFTKILRTRKTSVPVMSRSLPPHSLTTNASPLT